MVRIDTFNPEKKEDKYIKDVLEKIDLSKRINVIVGPKGCGKTTILKKYLESNNKALDLTKVNKPRDSIMLDQVFGKLYVTLAILSDLIDKFKLEGVLASHIQDSFKEVQESYMFGSFKNEYDEVMVSFIPNMLEEFKKYNYTLVFDNIDNDASKGNIFRATLEHTFAKYFNIVCTSKKDNVFKEYNKIDITYNKDLEKVYDILQEHINIKYNQRTNLKTKVRTFITKETLSRMITELDGNINLYLEVINRLFDHLEEVEDLSNGFIDVLDEVILEKNSGLLKI